MDRGGAKEELKHCICAVIVVGLDANYQSTLSINECMDYDLPSNQTYAWVSLANAEIIEEPKIPC